MKASKLLRIVGWSVFGLGLSAGAAAAQQAGSLLGVNCNAPPALACVGARCLTTDANIVTQPGNTVEPKTRRTFFLDCPAGYKPGDKVNVLLSLHGGGSYANWQRNYFPAIDVKDKYKLVIITPGSPTRAWEASDDAFLANMVDMVVGQVGKQNVERFILAGHSQGGMTSNRIICTDYFKDKVDVRISLSGGRVGPTIAGGRGFGAGGQPVWQGSGELDGAPGSAPAAAAAPGRGGPPAAAAAPGRGGPPPAAAGPAGGACDYSFIYSVGEYENIPGDTSPLATKFGCAARVRQPDVVDQVAGKVWDATRQDPGTDGWGHYPRSGKAQVWTFPNCKDGRVVADVIKLRKGHTEGYEPNVTDKLIELAVSAKGGKIANGAWNPPAPPARPAAPGAGAPGRGGAAPAAAAPAVRR